MGAQLDHAARASTDSAGARTGRPYTWAHLPPADARRPNGQRLDSPTYVPHRLNGEGEGGYEVSGENMELVADASRKLRRVNAQSNMAYAVLATYYGDAGAWWAQASQDRYMLDEHGQRIMKHGYPHLVYEGVGPGSIGSLFPFTVAGRELLRYEERIGRALAEPDLPAPPPGKRRGKGPPPPPLPGLVPCPCHPTCPVQRPRRDHLVYVEHRKVLVIDVEEREKMLATVREEYAVRLEALGKLQAQKREAAREAKRGIDRRITGVRKGVDELEAAMNQASAALQVQRDALVRLHGVRSAESDHFQNPAPDPATAHVIAECQRLRSAHALAQKDYAQALAAYQAAGAHGGPPLPTPPPPLVLPQMPQARVRGHVHRAPADHLTAHERIQSAIMMRRREEKKPPAERSKWHAQRARLLDMAQKQAIALLERSSLVWDEAAGTRRLVHSPARFCLRPGSVLTHRAPAPPIRLAKETP